MVCGRQTTDAKIHPHDVCMLNDGLFLAVFVSCMFDEFKRAVWLVLLTFTWAGNVISDHYTDTTRDLTVTSQLRTTVRC